VRRIARAGVVGLAAASRRIAELRAAGSLRVHGGASSAALELPGDAEAVFAARAGRRASRRASDGRAPRCALRTGERRAGRFGRASAGRRTGERRAARFGQPSARGARRVRLAWGRDARRRRRGVVKLSLRLIRSIAAWLFLDGFSTSVARFFDVPRSEVAFGEQPIVRRAQQPQIVDRFASATRPRSLMMDLKKRLRRASATIGPLIAALQAVSLDDLTQHRTRDVTAPSQRWRVLLFFPRNTPRLGQR